MINFGAFRCLGCGISLSKHGVIRPLLLPQSSEQNISLQLIRRCYARGTQRHWSQDQHYQHQQQALNPLLRYLRTLRWVPIPLGFAYISYQQYGHVVKREEKKQQKDSDTEELLSTTLLVRLYQILPLKVLSRLWGVANNVELPLSLRMPLFRTYSRVFRVNLEEPAVRDLNHYRNLGEFFRRRLRPGVRPIDSKSLITCPADGTVLHFGKAEAGLLEQVKGITYSLQEFLGPNDWFNEPRVEDPSKAKSRIAHSGHGRMARMHYMEQMKSHSGNALYHCVIYLGPGDYHGFHSPTEWVVSYRRHFPGELFSVNPGVARLVRGLFNLNERAVYVGHYKHGFFAMIAVGATNVGNIRVYHDKYLSTNDPSTYPAGVYLDESYQTLNQSGIPMKQGESFGEFNLGSTIVLVFEAPKDFVFKIKHGQRVQYGQALGGVPVGPKEPPPAS